MHAMVLTAPGAPLVWTELPDPELEWGEVRAKVDTCGVCRTDLHVVDGELPDIGYPIVPGHEMVGRVHAVVHGVNDLSIGMRVCVPRLGFTCGTCPCCQRHEENLCDHPKSTGHTRDGAF